ncbi:hypothetical protein JXA85_00390 [Candidatus Woesearchaeota archaeon]|nr:hypothetical protein [Candidatus Woesearchaeota archaeon]
MESQNNLEGRLRERIVIKHQIRETRKYLDSVRGDYSDPFDLERHIEKKKTLLKLSYLADKLKKTNEEIEVLSKNQGSYV